MGCRLLVRRKGCDFMRDFDFIYQEYASEIKMLMESCNALLMNPSEINLRLMARQLGTVRELQFIISKIESGDYFLASE